jgi:hypothetical protein
MDNAGHLVSDQREPEPPGDAIVEQYPQT